MSYHDTVLADLQGGFDGAKDAGIDHRIWWPLPSADTSLAFTLAIL